MEVSKSKIEQAVAIIGDGGDSDCVVMVLGRHGELLEVSYQEWLRIGELVNARYGYTEAAAWQEPTWYGDSVVEVE